MHQKATQTTTATTTEAAGNNSQQQQPETDRQPSANTIQQYANLPGFSPRARNWQWHLLKTAVN